MNLIVNGRYFRNSEFNTGIVLVKGNTVITAATLDLNQGTLINEGNMVNDGSVFKFRNHPMSSVLIPPRSTSNFYRLRKFQAGRVSGWEFLIH
jgi:adhesin HecA-like repeat protein